MVCIYCGQSTRIINSRPQKRLQRTWRRRSCLTCKATFTTIESVDLATSIIVRHSDGSLSPFERDTLFVSVYQAVGHRNQAVTDAAALTDTITATLFRNTREAYVVAPDIIATTLQVLTRFDSTAATLYAAYHPLPKR